MIFGASEYQGIPWETIIKLYRKELKNASFDRVEQYAQDFLKFLVDRV